ncbi:unnamed protein product [Paramecium pentaurelia]|uniref:1-phosphatidylinositol 4-kinase n=1 Tax=Paramecium pentaurelia TaxID=43138 RepID=A0A8S1U133_9CILI|nr:unnamed protein product [Paramecium pentaurelia]
MDKLPRQINEMNIDSKTLNSQIRSTNTKQILNFFSSQEFTPELLIYYYMATFNEPGPHQYLTQKLLQMPHTFIENFIPQFSYLAIKKGSKSMETFLETLCQTSIANFLKISWCINAYSENEKQNEITCQQIEFFQRKLEKSMVNGAIKYSKEEILKNMNNVEFQIQLQNQFSEKELRSSYIGLVEKLVMNLIKLSLTLKLIDPSERKQFLFKEIKNTNKALKRLRNQYSEIPYYWGTMLPFQRKYEGQDPSNLIVRICEEGYACFNTKTRVPYRILVETISEEEIKQKQTRLSQDVSTDVDQDDLLHREISDDLESQLRYHTKCKMEDSIFNQLPYYKYDKSTNYEDSLPDSPNKLEQNLIQKSSFTTPKIKRRNSWSSSTTITDFSVTLSEAKQSKECDDLKRHQRQRTSINLPTPSKNNQLLKEINLKEEEYLLEQEKKSKERKKILVKMQGPWGEDWDHKLELIKEQSPFKDFESYQIRAIMVKGGDDLRQELMAMQVIQKLDSIFKASGLNLYLKPYEIIVTSENSGLLEFVPNTISMDAMKKYLKSNKFKSLREFFKFYFGEDFHFAQRNFIESLAGYSLLTYIMQIKDRHNGNILIDNQGHLIHIDFGFILSISPGNAGFETAPFKMTQDYIELMDGSSSKAFQYFTELMISGFLELRKSCAALLQIIELMMEKSNFHCFSNFDIKEFKDRFKLQDSVEKCKKNIITLINDSLNNKRTYCYDKFQQLTNGISP